MQVRGHPSPPASAAQPLDGSSHESRKDACVQRRPSLLDSRYDMLSRSRLFWPAAAGPAAPSGTAGYSAAQIHAAALGATNPVFLEPRRYIRRTRRAYMPRESGGHPPNPIHPTTALRPCPGFRRARGSPAGRAAPRRLAAEPVARALDGGLAASLAAVGRPPNRPHARSPAIGKNATRIWRRPRGPVSFCSVAALLNPLLDPAASRLARRRKHTAQSVL
jgi:hypothetical protein